MTKSGKHSIEKKSNMKLFIIIFLFILIITFIFINKSTLINYIKQKSTPKNITEQISNTHEEIEILSFDIIPKSNSEYEIKIKIKNNSNKSKTPFVLSVSLLDANQNVIETFENIISATEPGEEIFSTKILQKDLSSYSTYEITKKEL